MIQSGYVRAGERRSPGAARVFTAPVAEPEVVARAGGRYGDKRGPSWSAVAAILAAHLLLIGLLAYLDVIPFARKQVARLTVMEIQPDKIVPPPPAAPTKAPVRPVEHPIVTPPPIVQTIAPPPELVTAPTPPPPAPPAPTAAPPAVSGATSEIGSPVSPPNGLAKTLGNPSPRYPMEARRRHWEGIVRLRVVISAEGRVKEISVARSSGFDVLDEEALKVVAGWRFLPGKQAGVAVEAVGYVPIPFRLT